jgi:hypothetical protein
MIGEGMSAVTIFDLARHYARGDDVVVGQIMVLGVHEPGGLDGGKPGSAA